VSLSAPANDGAADHLPGRSLPSLALPATDGSRVSLDELADPTVVFVHPGIGGPAGPGAIEEWTALPGARGCTPEACSFRDELTGFHAAGAAVLGLSSQSPDSQREAAGELGLPYRLLSDEGMKAAQVLELPTFEFRGESYLRRVTLIVGDATVREALYPVFPPEDAARQALDSLAR